MQLGKWPEREPPLYVRPADGRRHKLKQWIYGAFCELGQSDTSHGRASLSYSGPVNGTTAEA